MLPSDVQQLYHVLQQLQLKLWKAEKKQRRIQIRSASRLPYLEIMPRMLHFGMSHLPKYWLGVLELTL